MTSTKGPIWYKYKEMVNLVWYASHVRFFGSDEDDFGVVETLDVCCSCRSLGETYIKRIKTMLHLLECIYKSKGEICVKMNIYAVAFIGVQFAKRMNQFCQIRQNCIWPAGKYFAPPPLSYLILKKVLQTIYCSPPRKYSLSCNYPKPSSQHWSKHNFSMIDEPQVSSGWSWWI